MRVAATTALTIAALTCGTAPSNATTDASAADRDAITKVLNVALKSRDVTALCAAYTPTMFKNMYGSTKPCHSKATHSSGDAPIQVAVYSISVSGARATAKVSVKGGDGASGTWELTRSGKTWRVSLIRANYWRSGFQHVFGPKYSSQGPKTDPFDNDAYRACGLKAFLARSDKALLTAVYQYRAAHNATFGKAFSTCTKKAPHARSPFRTVFETGFKQGAKNAGATPAFSSCVLTKMRSEVPEANLINIMVDGPKSSAWSKLDKQIQTWAAACGRAGAAGKIRAPQGIVAPHPVR